MAPKVSAVQARNDPRGSKGFALAEALGAAGPQINEISKRVEDREREAAQSYANSMTAEDLNKMVREGKLPVSKSPLFVATVQNIAGQNIRDGIERQLFSDMEQGKISFATDAELDQELRRRRDEALAGGSSFEVAGFDKGWQQLRQKALDVNTRLNDKKAVEQGIQVATERLQNTTAKVTSPDAALTQDEQVGAILTDYDLLSNPKTGGQLLRDDARKTALDGVIFSLAKSGNVSLVKALIDSKLPNNGPTMFAYLGSNRATVLLDLAQNQFDRQVRERETTLKRQADQVVTEDAVSRATEMVSMGRGPEVSSVGLPSGSTLKAEDLRATAVQKIIAADPEMTFADQILLHSRNNVENEVWKSSLRAAAINLNEITIDSNGKPVGTLSESTIKALDEFAVINQVAPAYALQLLGEEKYEKLSDIQVLRDFTAGGDPNKAAMFVNQAANNKIDPAQLGRITTNVQTVMDDLKDTPMFRDWLPNPKYFGEIFRGEMGEGEKNLVPIEGKVRRLAKLLFLSGQAESPSAAVEMIGEYIKNPAVTTQINNTIYFNKDLPKVPPEESTRQAEWFERYMVDGIGKRLKENGFPFKMGDLTLKPLEGGVGTYQVQLRAQGIPSMDGRPGYHVVTRREIEAWIESEVKLRNDQKNTAVNERIQNRNNAPQSIGDIIIAP
jgi:hypothetical protein